MIKKMEMNELKIKEIFDDCRSIAVAIKRDLPKLSLIKSSRIERFNLVSENMDFFYNGDALVDSSDYLYFREHEQEFINLIIKYKI